MNYWLSREVLAWTPDVASWTSTDPVRAKRPYEILAHAESVLANAQTALALSDAILALKRVIDSRLRHLDELYRFSARFPGNKVGALERLEQVGLAKPFVVKQLFEIRNDIEHRDLPPPSLNRAKELVDVAWYFLRATDQPCRCWPRELTLRSDALDGNGDKPWIIMCPPSSPSGMFRVSGWVPPQLIGREDAGGSVEVRPLPETQLNPLRDGQTHVFGDAFMSPDTQREVWRLAFAGLD
ncbi:MAG TPA: hypothetical protein VFE82_09130 [Ramlibacter sp.]|jgi:hypothetical protein|uniref:hypothetical protein n=1 Tax=Ramlibacter sp. TaxID=1917967 RepID=UPI002D4D4A4F|nr:hypothetical protein [Ramlibacter sp.]HZY18633.1 hypothetical protein [Ramlibacter sp.]